MRLDAIAKLQNEYTVLMAQGMTKQQLCDLVVPFRDCWGLTDTQALMIARGEMSLQDAAECMISSLSVQEQLFKLINDKQVYGIDQYQPEEDEILLLDNEELAEHLASHGVVCVPGVPEADAWISVKDRLPVEEAKAFELEYEEYPEFIVQIDRGQLPTTLSYDWQSNEWFVINTALHRETYKVTHWQPYPSPPNER